MNLKLSGVLVGAAVAWACVVAPTAQAASKATPLANIPNSAAAQQTWSVDRTDFRIPFGTKVQEEVEYEANEIVNDYFISKDKIYKGRFTPEAGSAEQKVWDLFMAIAGPEIIKKDMRQYVTYKVPSPVLGFVGQVSTKDPMFALAINTNASNFSNKIWARDIAITLTHEYAHLLTLDNNQVRYKSIKTGDCKKKGMYVVRGVGCAFEDSYLNQFAKKFWTPTEQAKAEADARTGTTELYYNQHRAEFTSKYAASNPEEDIAESFTDFVLRAKPVGTLVRDQKMLFFYQYPELVQLRNSIRAAIAPYVAPKK